MVWFDISIARRCDNRGHGICTNINRIYSGRGVTHTFCLRHLFSQALTLCLPLSLYLSFFFFCSVHWRSTPCRLFRTSISIPAASSNSNYSQWQHICIVVFFFSQKFWLPCLLFQQTSTNENCGNSQSVNVNSGQLKKAQIKKKNTQKSNWHPVECYVQVIRNRCQT